MPTEEECGEASMEDDNTKVPADGRVPDNIGRRALLPKAFCDQRVCSPANLRITAKAFDPGDIWLPAEPCLLPLGVVAVALLRSGHGLVECSLAAKILERLPVAQRMYRRYVPAIAVALQQQARLPNQAVVEHLFRALINAFVEL